MLSFIQGGDFIKKNIGIILLAISLCFVFSKAMFSTYHNEQVFSSDGNIYLLQYGSYINEKVMKENIQKLDNYITYEDDGKYYVFLGCFTNLSNAKKMSKIFENKNIYTYIKNDYLGNSDVIEKIKELEKDIMEINDIKEISDVNDAILNLLKSVVY